MDWSLEWGSDHEEIGWELGQYGQGLYIADIKGLYYCTSDSCDDNLTGLTL